MAEKSLHSKLKFDFKSLVAGAIDRTQLKNLILSSQQVLLISAPSGFGKTFLLAGYLNSVDQDFLYQEISTDSSNLISFLHAFVYGCDLPQNIFKEVSELIQKNKIKLSQYSKESYPIFKNILSVIFSSSDKKIYIIENCDFVKRELWFKHLSKIISELLLKEVKFIFTGIEISSGIFLYPISKGIFSEIRKDKFDLTNNEIKNFADKIYNLKISENEILSVKEITGGWITGLHLIFHNYEYGIKSVKGNHILLLNEYFKEEILSNIDNNSLDILLKASFFDEINDSIQKNLNTKQKVTDVFNSLVAKIPFIYHNSSSDYFYFNKTFKFFLQSEFKINNPKKLYSNFLSSVADFYYQKSDYNYALDLYLQSGNVKSALSLISSMALNLYRNNDFYIVQNWFSTIEKNSIKVTGELIYIKALLYKNYYQNYSESVNLFNQFLKSESKKDFMYYKAIAHIAEIYLNLNDIKSALSTLKKSLLKCPDKYKPFILFRLHSSYYKLNDIQKCKSILSEALDLISKQKSLSPEFEKLKINIINAIGNICFLNGELNEALEHYKKVYEKSEIEYNRIQTRLNICEVYSKSGKFKEAKKILNDLKSDEKLLLIPELKNQIEFVELNFLYESGDNLNLNKLFVNSFHSKDKEIQYIYLKSLLIVSDFEKAKSVIKKLDSDLNPVFNLQIQILKSVLNKKFNTLNNLISKLESESNSLIFIEITSLTLMILIKLNNLKLSSLLLNRLKSAFKNINYINVISNYLKHNSDVYDKIIMNNYETVFFRDIYFNINSLDELFSDVYVKYFGIPEIIVRGKNIPDKLWKRNKFKEIFLYLYFNLNKRVSKDEIIERFYPDADKNYSENIFHQFLSALRNVLAGNSINKNIEFIKYINKIFEPDKNYILISDVEIIKKLSVNKNLNLPESFITDSYSEPFMKNYFDDFAESNREYFSALKDKIISGK